MTDKTWAEGDEVTYYGAKLKVKIFAGLFWYAGFGMGDYYAKDGTVRQCTGSEAAAFAEQDGVPCVRKDSFDYYQPIYLGD